MANDSRGYQVFLRGPVASMQFCFGTTDGYRNALWHQPLLSVMPSPSDSLESDFGIIGGGSFTAEIADEPADVNGVGLDWFLLQEDGSRILLEDASGSLILEY